MVGGGLCLRMHSRLQRGPFTGLIQTLKCSVSILIFIVGCSGKHMERAFKSEWTGQYLQHHPKTGHEGPLNSSQELVEERKMDTPLFGLQSVRPTFLWHLTAIHLQVLIQTSDPRVGDPTLSLAWSHLPLGLSSVQHVFTLRQRRPPSGGGSLRGSRIGPLPQADSLAWRGALCWEGVQGLRASPPHSGWAFALAALLGVGLGQGRARDHAEGRRDHHGLHGDLHHRSGSARAGGFPLAQTADVVLVLRHLTGHAHTHLVEPLVTAAITLHPVHLRDRERHTHTHTHTPHTCMKTEH